MPKPPKRPPFEYKPVTTADLAKVGDVRAGRGEHVSYRTKTDQKHAYATRVKGSLKEDFDHAWASGDGSKFISFVWSLLKETKRPVYELAIEVGFAHDAAKYLQTSFAALRVEGVGLRATYDPGLRGDELTSQLRKNLSVLATSFDEGTIESMSGKDRAFALGIHFDKVQVADGKPTEIIGVEHRVALDDAARDLAAEIERRKALKTITVQAVDVTEDKS